MSKFHNYLLPLLAMLTGLALAPLASACDLSVIGLPSPVSGTAFTFTSNIANCPSIYSVEYAIDVSGETVCVTTQPPYSCTWNTFNSYNSEYHSVIATARDALNTTLVVSSPVDFILDNWLPEHRAQLTMVVTPSQSVGSPISGNLSITKSFNGTNSSTSQVSYYTRIDGLFAYDTNGGGVFGSNTPDTRLYENGTHTLTVVGFDTVNAIEQPPYLGSFQQFSQYEKVITTANTNSPMEIRTNAWEMFLCPGGATLCPATFTLTAQIYNTDGSTSTCTSPAFVSATPAVATVGPSSGVVTAITQGSTTITVTCSGFPRNRQSWVFVNNQNTYPNFGMDSSGNAHIFQAYDPTSVYVGSSFQSCAGAAVTAGFFDSNYPPGKNFATDYLNSGWNTCEAPLGVVPAETDSQSTFQNNQDAIVHTMQCATGAVAGVGCLAFNSNAMFLLIGDSQFKGDPAMVKTMHGKASTYSPQAPQYMSQSWVGKRGVASSGGDEIQSAMGDLSMGTGIIGGGVGSGWTAGGAVTCVSTATFTDLTIDGTNNKLVASATYTFVSGDVSHYVTVITNTGGWVAGNYVINSVSAGKATLASSPGTVGLTGGSFNVNICTVTNYPFSSVSAAQKIIITNSGDANLDFNFSSNTAAPYVVTCVNPGCAPGTSTTFKFATPAGVGTKTYTAGTNPNLTIQSLIGNVWNANISAACPTGSGPCPLYIHNVDYANASALLETPANHFPVGWSNSAATSVLSQRNWAAIGEFSSIYYADGQPQWLAQLRATTDLQTAKGLQMRTWYSALKPAAPVLIQVGGINTTYNLDGYTPSTIGGCTISTIANNLVTCTGPHKLVNILDNNTRVTISGTSLSTDNSQFFINSAPTTNTFTIYYRKGQFTENDTPHNVNGVVNFSNGTSVKVYVITSAVSDTAITLTINSDTSCAVTPHTPGTYATFTGSAMGSFVGPTFYVPYSTFVSACSGGSATMKLFQVPSGSSTGGTTNIQPSNTYVRGINIPILGSEQGPRHMFADSMYNPILRASGARLYVLGENWDGNGSQQLSYSTTFTSKNIATGIQSGASPRWDSGGGVLAWQSVSLPMKWIQQFKPYIFQPSLVSPDYGPKLECAARQGPSGNLLMCQSFSDGSVTRTIDLTPYLVTGQTILRYSMTWQGLTITPIAANTTSDTVTIDPAGFVGYLFSNIGAAEYAPPTLTVKLASISNAAQVVVQYSYLPFPFNPTTTLAAMMTPQSVDCSTGVSCVIPVDLRMGPIYYRILYLNSSGTVLATSDIQTIAQQL